MGAMTDTPKGRARLRYQGDERVQLVGSAYPNPAVVAPGDEVTVAAHAVPGLLAQVGRWVLLEGGGEHVLKGAALDQALEAAGLPRTGSADEKRARLAEHERQGHDDSTSDSDSADGADTGEQA